MTWGYLSQCLMGSHDKWNRRQMFTLGYVLWKALFLHHSVPFYPFLSLFLVCPQMGRQKVKLWSFLFTKTHGTPNKLCVLHMFFSLLHLCLKNIQWKPAVCDLEWKQISLMNGHWKWFLKLEGTHVEPVLYCVKRNIWKYKFISCCDFCPIRKWEESESLSLSHKADKNFPLAFKMKGLSESVHLLFKKTSPHSCVF